MKSRITNWIAATTLAAVGSFSGPAYAASGAGVKNLAAPTSQARAYVEPPREMTKRDARELARTAESRADHLKLARFYRGEVDRLASLASRYEQAADTLREHPVAKNLAAPNTAGVYEFLAEGFRSEAAENRELEAKHDNLAGF